MTASLKHSYITTYLSVSGWKAVQMWWNPDHGGFWEPYQTGIGYYDTQDEAVVEAKQWAESEGVEYVDHLAAAPSIIKDNSDHGAQEKTD